MCPDGANCSLLAQPSEEELEIFFNYFDKVSQGYIDSSEVLSPCVIRI